MRVVAPAGLIAERYRLLSPLGSGSSATVWAAADETLGRQVALKLLSSEAPADAADRGQGGGGSDSRGERGDLREQLRREARALAALTHPHIIVVFDFLETPGFDGAAQPVLITELLEGRSLTERLAEGPLPWAEALSVCGQLASALAAAHRAGIVHRDVAPGNVMLTGSGVKLLDFGLAEAIVTAKDPTEDGMTAGTPVCMAPEQLIGLGALPASDVYGLGCVLHWCLTGRPPYRDRDIVWLSQAHLRAEPPPLAIDGLPEGIDELYLACLAKEPDERPTAEEAAAMLAPYAPTSAAASLSAAVDAAGSAVASDRVYSSSTRFVAASRRRQSRAEDATEFLPMIVSDGVASYVSPETTATTGTGATNDTAPPSPAPAAPGRHAGNARPIDRRRMLPLTVLLASLTIIALLTFGLVQTMDGAGTTATGTTGAATGSATPPAASSATATVGSVVLPPGGSAATGASASASASPSASASASAAGSASPSASAAVSASPSMAPSQAATSPVALAPLPDPAADPLGYVQGLRNQVQTLIAQGPATLQPDAGQNLLKSLADLQNLVAAAQQHPGNKQWRDVANRIAAIEQQVSTNAGGGQISPSAANTLVGELQSLARSLPAGNSNGDGNGNGNGG